MNEAVKSFETLQHEWRQLQEMTNTQARGKAFEPWLKNLFRAAGLDSVGSFERKKPRAELDGAVHLGSDTFLLEAKWKKKKIDAEPVMKLKSRVESSTIQTSGLLISVSDFNQNAIEQAGLMRPLQLYLIGTDHLEALLNEQIDGETWLRTLMRLAARQAKVYIPIADILSEPAETITPGGTCLLTALPLRKLDLIGRDKDLEILEKSLTESQRILLINGLGGIGKTEVCKRFFMDHYQHYHAAGWVDYVSTLDDSFLNAVTWDSPTAKKHLQAQPDDTPDVRLQKIKRFLEQTDLEILLVVDNVADGADKSLETLLRLPKNVKVIATSRLAIEGFERHRLDFLSADDCRELFDRFYDGEPDDAAVAKIVDLCGRHTLTVELLARTANTAGKTAGELYDTLREKGFDLEEVIRDRVSTFWHDETDYKPLFKHLLAIFHMSGVTSAEQHLLANLSVLPPVYIPVSDIIEWLGLETGEDIKSLERKGWLRREKMKIFMHPVIQEVIRHQTKPDAEACEKLIDSLACKLHRDPEENPLTKEGFIIFAASLLRYINEDNKYVAALANSLSLMYNDFGQLEQALEMQLIAKAILKKLLPGNHPILARSYHNLAGLYRATNQPEQALEIQLKTVAINEKMLGKNDPTLAISYNILSLIYADQGLLKLAQDIQLKAITIWKAIGNDLHPGLATSYNNLGVIYQDMGQLELAREVHLKALTIREKVLDKTHPDLSQSYNNLAGIYMVSKDYTTAEAYAEKAVAILQKLFPDGHPELDLCNRNLEVLRRDKNG